MSVTDMASGIMSTGTNSVAGTHPQPLFMDKLNRASFPNKLCFFSYLSTDGILLTCDL